VTATITFSLELELGWGLVQYNKLNALSPDRRAETESLERLLGLCDKLNIPLTINVVGHLLRDSPLSSYDGGHEPGWFEATPTEDPEDSPEFYAPDLINRIKTASADHEICTHTFTHVECENISRETLRWELDNVLEAHDEFGLRSPVSLVPPRHSPPPRDILREYGIDIVRAPRKRAPNTTDASNKFKLGIDILKGAQPITPPRIVEGVVETYCTRYPSLTAPFLPSGQLDPHPSFKIIPPSVRRWLHQRNMNATLSRAIERDSHAHFWTHLWETTNGQQWPQIEQFLQRVATARERDHVRIRTMRQLNKEARSSKTKL